MGDFSSSFTFHFKLSFEMTEAKLGLCHFEGRRMMTEKSPNAWRFLFIPRPRKYISFRIFIEMTIATIKLYGKKKPSPNSEGSFINVFILISFLIEMLFVFVFEFINTSCTVNKFHLTCEEWM